MIHLCCLVFDCVRHCYHPHTLWCGHPVGGKLESCCSLLTSNAHDKVHQKTAQKQENNKNTGRCPVVDLQVVCVCVLCSSWCWWPRRAGPLSCSTLGSVAVLVCACVRLALRRVLVCCMAGAFEELRRLQVLCVFEELRRLHVCVCIVCVSCQGV